MFKYLKLIIFDILLTLHIPPITSWYCMFLINEYGLCFLFVGLQKTNSEYFTRIMEQTFF